MEFNYLVEKKRMLDSLGRTSGVCIGVDCDDCPLSEGEVKCRKLETNSPLRATEIVRKWAEEHPRKTRKDVLLEKFPNAIIYSGDNCPQTCARLLGFCSHDECGCHENCDECWNTEVE